MTGVQKNLIIEAKKWCDDNEKSTEFMLQYISDVAKIDYDKVVEFLISNNDI